MSGFWVVFKAKFERFARFLRQTAQTAQTAQILLETAQTVQILNGLQILNGYSNHILRNAAGKKLDNKSIRL